MQERRDYELSMSYTDRGEGRGDPVVLLHAFPLNGRMWRPQQELLASGRRVITPDYPGFGRSAGVALPAQPDMGFYAAQLRELLDRLEIDRVVLGGISMGGYVAFAVLRLFPERVSGLLLANTRPDPDPEDARAGRDHAIRRVAEGGVGVLPELYMERLLSRQTLEERPQVVEEVEAMVYESSPDGVVAALGALRERPDSTPVLGEIEVPALVIRGEEDALSSPEVMSQMADRIPGSHRATLSGAGHLSNLEAPEEFNAAFGEFLSSL